MKPDSSSQSQQKTREKVEPKKRGMKAGKKTATTKKGAKKSRESRTSNAGGPGVSDRPASPLLPLRQFVDNPSQMIEQLFQAVGREELDVMQPTILQDLPLEEVKQLCLKQLEVMSKQDILDILSGCEVKDQKSSTAKDSASSSEKKTPSDVKKEQEKSREGGQTATESCEALELFPATEDMEVLAMHEPPTSSPDKASKGAPGGTQKPASEGDLATNLTKMQMEILELQLRRRAIKALLRSQKGPGEEGEEMEEEEEEMIAMKEENG